LLAVEQADLVTVVAEALEEWLYQAVHLLLQEQFLLVLVMAALEFTVTLEEPLGRTLHLAQ
jgi:hypothetical protein